MLTVLVLLVVIISCGSSKFSKEYIEKYDTGEPNLINDFHNLRDEIYEVPYLDTTLTFVQYNGTASIFYTDKVMFDKYGTWSKFYFEKLANREFIMWEDVKMTLDKKPISIITSGDENKYTTKASFAAFDNDGNDLLTEGSPYRQELIDEMAALIRQNDDNEKEFYKRYWQARNPKIYRVMLRDGKFDPEPEYDMKR